MSDTMRRERMLAAWNGMRGATWQMRIRIVQRLGGAAPTPAQMGVLQALMSDQGGMTPRKLSGCLHVTPATVTGNLNALEEEGLIERTRSGDDRRVVHICVTDRGRERVKRWRAIFEAELQKYFAPLDDDDLRQLSSLLAKLGSGTVRQRSPPVSSIKTTAQEDLKPSKRTFRPSLQS